MECLALYVLFAPLAVALYFEIRTQRLAQQVRELDAKLARWEQREEFRDRLNGKRREDRNPPAASDDQSKTNTHAIQKGGRP